MVRRLGPVLACLLGCGDGEAPAPPDLLGALAARSVASVPAEEVLAIALAGIDARRFVIASATTQGGDFCVKCLDPGSTDCAATCRRAVLELMHRRTDGGGELSYRFHEVFPRTPAHDVGGLEVVALDAMHVGVAWRECDLATCSAGRAKETCSAYYTAVDLATGQRGPIEMLYQDWYGDLALAYDARTGRVLALLAEQAASGVGVRAAIFDARDASLIAPWESYGGAAARAATATASAGGFVIVADDPAPGEPAADPCTQACDCAAPAVSEAPTGGLYAFWPGIDRAAERIAPGRGPDEAYGAREAIAAIEAGGRVIVASTQAIDGTVELFEAATGGWVRRHSSPAPSPLWLGALGDATYLAWIGAEPADGTSGEQRLVAGVVLDQLEQRGELAALGPGAVLRAAPARAGDAVTATFLLHGAWTPGGGPTPHRFEVLAVGASW